MNTVDNTVISISRNGREKTLKFYSYPSGIQRVTLYRDKIPHYIFLSQFTWDDSSDSVGIVAGRTRVRVPKAAQKALKTTKSGKVSEKDLPQNKENTDEQESVIEFFHTRENRPMRKDAFCAKFSKEILERQKEILKEEKTEKGTFYSLIKRFYA